MRTACLAIRVAAVVVALSTAGPPAARAQTGEPEAPVAPAPPPSLYQRLGGYDAIAALTDDFIARLTKDRLVSRFFLGLTDESKGRVRQLIVEQICAVAGGPCVYIGRDMKSAHRGLGIGEAEWTATVGHMIASLNLREVGPKEKDEILRFVGSMKKHIVEKS